MKMTDTDTENQPSGRTTLHNVRFYNLSPRAINVMAHNKLTHKLALSRADGGIEIWDVQHAPLLIKSILRSTSKSVEALAWAGERLFSAGLTGELVEWNLQTFQPINRQFVTGNAIWCLAVNSQATELAIGTEEGFINIFDIADGAMQYKHLFDRQEGRVLCCKFDATDEFLVTGSIGVIRIWNVASGHAVQKMTLSQHSQARQSIVWSLQVLSDFTIFSGDSRGCVIAWDGRTGAQIESHQVLKADVLTIAVNEDENYLICSGIDPIIRIYAKTTIRKEDMTYHRWVKFLQRSIHDHDIKTVLCVGDLIYSGGVDGYLGVSSLSKTKSNVSKYGPFFQNPCTAVAPAANLLLLRYKYYLEVWRMGTTSGKVAHREESKESATKAISESKPLAIDVGPEKLLELKSKRHDPIICATISPDGQWIVYSSKERLRIFRFVAGVGGKSRTQVMRIKYPPEQFTAASHIQFSSDSKRLFLITDPHRQIQVFAVLANRSSDFDFVECIETSKHIKDTIHLFTVSPCGMYLAVAGTDRTIAIWSVHKGKHFKHHMNLPRYSALPSAIAIHAQQPRLVAAFTDGKVFEYDFEEMHFTCSDRDNFVPSAEHFCATTVLLDARNPSIFILQNDANFFVLEKCSEQDNNNIEYANENHKSLKKSKRTVTDTKVSTLRLTTQKTFEHLINVAWLNNDQLVAISVNPTSMIIQLPAGLMLKKFGAM